VATHPRVLVLYATAQGQTRRIAERFAAELGSQDVQVQMLDLAELPEGVSVGDWDGVAIGVSVHGGNHLKAAAEFARQHRPQLDARPTAFFSVSLAAADEDDEAVAAAREYLDSFVEETGWQPTICASFAGAILYSHYGTFERILMRLIMRRKGHGDVKWDQEYTDWEAVAAFAKDFAAAVAGHAARRAAGAAHG
jgi:menaquinone-dependent protoporphyrinogen oxidase